MPKKQILKTFVSDGTSIFPMDTIAYEGGFWLVPEWLESASEGWRAPARIIRLDNLGYQDLREASQPADFVVNEPIPRAVFEGRAQGPSAARYVIVERPPVPRR
jgi:hypothetical protein